MSTVCQSFVQNTWKKDFCSNCFKSKDEHANEKSTHKTSYFATPFHSKSTFLSKSPKPLGNQGILKLSPKKKHKRAVSFPQEVSQVIGYGGDVWSDDDEFQMSEVGEEDDYVPDCEEEKQLKLVTKSNTDFNTVKANLLGTNGETKKSYTSLLLGRMQTDSDGKKKTLMVSVTPFGHENSTVKSSIAKLSEKKQSSVATINKNKENKTTDYKTNIILKSFVKNTESNEMINNNTNVRKDSESSAQVSEKSLLEEISETLEKNRICSANNNTCNENGDTKKNVSNHSKSSDDKGNGSPKMDKAMEIFEFKKNALVRNSPIKKDSEKPKVTILPKPEFTFCKIDIEPVNHQGNNELDNEIVSNSYAVDTITKSMASDEDSTSTKSDSDNDDRQFVETRNPVKKTDDSLKIQVFSNSKDSDSDDKTSTDISLEDIRKVDGQSDSLQDTYENHFQPQILDMPQIIPKIDPTSIFSVEASRESAGEPDGRADPEDMEPPALPRSPPPQVDPRPSFLHGIFKENSTFCRPVVPEKPKVPVKPFSVIKQNIPKRPQSGILPQQQQVIMQLQQTLNMTPKIICAPEILPSKDEIEVIEGPKNNDINSTISYEDSDSEVITKSPLDKQDSNCSVNLTPNKRKAPKPPPSGAPCEETSGSIYQRNPAASMKSDSPVVREKEKRERASSCSPKFRQGVNLNPTGEQPACVEKVPEPAPRRSLSLSHDNLLSTDDKKKGKMKFSLRKLLRIGSSKDLDKKDLQVVMEPGVMIKKEEMSELTPRPKPRLVIIHPLELNGSSVEVLKSATDLSMIVKHGLNDDISISDGSTYSGSSIGDMEDSGFKEIQTKPPPPPRKVAEESRSMVDGCPVKPARPPPPKSAMLLRQQKQPSWTPPPTRPADNVYANLGEVRSAIAPRKPERTASMREREAQLELPKKRMPSSEDSDGDLDAVDTIKIEVKQATSNDQPNHSYDDVYGSEKYEATNNNYLNNHKRNGSDSDYEFVSNCTSSTPQSRKLYPINPGLPRAPVKTFVPSHRKSDCNIDKSVDYLKFNNSFARSTSLQYCGSETESEIYSPYSFYSCSEVNESGSGDGAMNNTTNKLRVRKGRSVVHKNLEDNYGAVVIANHEALAQVLEQVQQSATMQPSLRGLKTCTNLRWTDFTVTSTASKGCGSLRVGKRIFHSAVWNSSSTNGAVNVTLMLHKEQMASQLISQHMMQPLALYLNPVTEFCDLVPLQQFGEEGNQLVQATVVVLPRTQVDTIQTFGEYLQEKASLSPSNSLQRNSKTEKDSPVSYENQHEATFMMLQLINGLKSLQARGMEELPASLSSFAIFRDNQGLAKTQLHGLCNLSDLGMDEGPTSIQMPKANSYGRLCVLQGLSEKIISNNTQSEEKLCSLCECAVTALKLLLPNDKLTPLIQDLLNKEKSISLSQVKSILEFTLWGPWDVVLGLPVKERELSLQRWLDLERATVLHGLVRTRVELNAFEQSHLMFLVRSSAKIMCDSSVLLEPFNIY